MGSSDLITIRQRAQQWLAEYERQSPNESSTTQKHTSCGNTWQFETGTPEDNKQQFCGYCGGKLLVVAQTGELEEC